MLIIIRGSTMNYISILDKILIWDIYILNNISNSLVTLRWKRFSSQCDFLSIFLLKITTNMKFCWIYDCASFRISSSILIICSFIVHQFSNNLSTTFIMMWRKLLFIIWREMIKYCVAPQFIQPLHPKVSQLIMSC